MEHFFTNVDLWNNLGVVGVFAGISSLVITERLVWHTRLKTAEERAERWERVALDALRGPAQAGVMAAEAAVNVVSALPDPMKREGSS